MTIVSNIINKTPSLKKFFRSDEYKEVKLLYDLYSLQSDDITNNEIIYSLDSKWSNCGLADRIRGIISCYALAKAQGRDFVIDHELPFRFETYFSSKMRNGKDWSVSNRRKSYSRWHARPVVIMNNSTGKKICNLPKRKQLHFYSNVDFVDVVNKYYKKDYTFQGLYSELFSPSNLLLQSVDEHLRALGNHYISISFRFIGLLGDFQDIGKKNIDAATQESIIDKCIKCIAKLHENKSEYKKVLVTADSPRFLDIAMKLPYVYIIPGKISHIGVKSNEEESLKTFVDFYMISQADEVFLGVAEKMYNSNFSRLAAYTTGKSFTVLNL